MIRAWRPRTSKSSTCTRSLTVRQELVQDGQVAIRADVVLVLFDFAADASRPMTDAERGLWAGFQV